MSEYDSHEWGDGMPHGNKSAGYVGLMIAKEQGKTRHDYNPKQRKKRIGKFDINKMSNPSDYLKHAYIDKYKDLHVGSPRRTWEQVKAQASDLKHAVATWARLHPNKDERTIARETGVSQPSVNRWKRLTGAGKEDMFSERERGLYERLLANKNPESVNMSVRIIKGGVLDEQKKVVEAFALLKGKKDPLITELTDILNKWGKVIEEYAGYIADVGTDYTDRIEELQEAGSDDEEAERELAQEPHDPEDSNVKSYDLDRLWRMWTASKKYFFQAVMIYKQIGRTIVKAVDQMVGENPADTNEIKLREHITPDEVDDVAYKEGKNYIVDEGDENEESGDPSGAGRRRGGSDGYANGVTSGNRMPNRIIQFAQKYEAKPVRGGNMLPNRIIQFAQKYERKPVRGGAKKAKQLYTKDGKLYNGLYHQMSNGEYHTGKKHGVRSKPLELR